MPILTPEERIGTQIAGRYRVEGVLGEGGMGVVLRGKHELTGRAVAIKLLLPTLVAQGEILDRFFQEAKAAAALNHPNVVDVLDMGVDDGDAYLVLELLEGKSLGELLDETPVLAPRVLLPILLPVIDALGAAHERGIIHRDLKPDNIFVAHDLRKRATPKVLDFGIAKLIEGDSSVATRTGAIVGTPQYMSPEQAMGKKDVGPECDVWAMGVILYQCLSGTGPFHADSVPALLLQVCSIDPPPIAERNPEVHPALGRVIERALAKDPTHRYRSMDALGHALTRAARDAGVTLPASFDNYFTGERETAAPPEPAPHATAERTGPLVAPVHSSAPTAEAKPVTPGGGRRGLMIAGALLALFGVGAITFAIAFTEEPELAPPPPPPPPAAPDAGALAAPDAGAPAVEIAARQVRVVSEPPGAEVRADGVTLGNTPLTVELAEGDTMELALSREGYRDATLTLDGETPDETLVSLRRRRSGRRPGGDDLAPR